MVSLKVWVTAVIPGCGHGSASRPVSGTGFVWAFAGLQGIPEVGHGCTGFGQQLADQGGPDAGLVFGQRGEQPSAA